MNSDDIHQYLNHFYPVSRETYDKLRVYIDELNKWQKKTNLIAPSTLDEIWQRHVADSLQVLSIVKSQVEPIHEWIDLGSGGGFPGMVCAIVLSEELQRQAPTLHFVESIQKKCAFLRHVGVKTDSKVEIHAERIERVAEKLIETKAFDVITARALTALPNLLTLSYPLFNPNTKAFFHKGQDFLCEIEQSHNNWRYDLVDYKSKIAENSTILEISNLSPL